MPAPRTLLVVEDEPDLVSLLKRNFQKEGYRCFSASAESAALALARREKPDVILLDVGLPGTSGLDLITQLRRETSAPVVFLSARASEIDRVLGLKLGADDYVVKPFSMAELIARIDRLLRRLKPRADGAALVHDGLAMDFERVEVRVKGRLVKLAPREFQLLKVLVQADGKVLSRDQLLTQVQGDDDGLGLEFSARTIDQHVARLRRKLRVEKKRIVTVHGSGYQYRA